MRVQVGLSDGELAGVDAARGLVSRSAWIRRLVLAALEPADDLGQRYADRVVAPVDSQVPRPAPSIAETWRR